MKLNAEAMNRMLREFDRQLRDDSQWRLGPAVGPLEPAKWECAESEAREPVKFEAGQVVRMATPEATELNVCLVMAISPDGYAGEARSFGSSRRFTFYTSPQSEIAELLSPAPRIGDRWTNGESVARVERESDAFRINERLRIVSEGEPFVGDVVAAARRLWEGGYRRVEAPHCGSEKPVYSRTGKLLGYPVRDAAGNVVAYGRTPRAQLWSPRDSTRVDRATGDDLRKLGEMYGVPELRAEMVVRESLKDYPDGARIFGVVQGATRSNVSVLWTGFVDACSYSLQDAATWIGDGRWRIVEPNVAPLASLANAVAAIFAQPDRATTRRYVDIACAQLRGEPLAPAIRAALVAACEEAAGGLPQRLSPHDIAMLIAGAREHERQRSRIAPGVRALSEAQLREVVCAAATLDGVAWTTRYARVYERARAVCR